MPPRCSSMLQELVFLIFIRWGPQVRCWNDAGEFSFSSFLWFDAIQCIAIGSGRVFQCSRLSDCSCWDFIKLFRIVCWSLGSVQFYKTYIDGIISKRLAATEYINIFDLVIFFKNVISKNFSEPGTDTDGTGLCFPQKNRFPDTFCGFCGGFFPLKHKKCLCFTKVFPWEKPFGNHKMCLNMGFSGGKHYPAPTVWSEGFPCQTEPEFELNWTGSVGSVELDYWTASWPHKCKANINWCCFDHLWGIGIITGWANLQVNVCRLGLGYG